jgi:hypothetical protein
VEYFFRRCSIRDRDVSRSAENVFRG